MANLSPETIPARSFYSAPRFTSKPNTKSYVSPSRKKTFYSTSPKHKSKSPQAKGINRGVAHKIRRRSRQDTALRSLDINFILNNIKNEKLRNRIETKREEKQQIEKVHNILRSSENPIALARPLRALNIGNDINTKLSTHTAENEELSPLPFEAETFEADFSDLDSLSDHDDDNDLSEKDFAALNPGIADDIKNEFNDFDGEEKEEGRSSSAQQENIETASTSSSRSATPNRKFFKSGKTASIPKALHLAGNIRATVCNGRISLISDKKVRNRKNSATAATLADAKAAVTNILKNLDNSVTDVQATATNDVSKEMHLPEISENSLNDIELLESNDYSEFRKRIPYETDDSVRIEEQHFLLDFLITHNICNEETFKIFISEPDSHRDKAANIVNEVLSAVNSEAGDIDSDIKNETIENINDVETDSAVALSSEELSTNNNSLEIVTETSYLIENTNTEKLFPIFYNNEKYKPLNKMPTIRRHQRNWNAGYGSNQYQIDAGQKEFGAKQCKQCGLVYTAHEPEEEKLHRDFHSSLHILRFKGWIDEDLVADFPEWGRDGRIIRITDTANIKRRERLNEILKIVDKELGFSSYIMPNIFVAFLAVRNCQIVGLCLVQPLSKANKYFCEDGIDYCTIEEFDVKCGISRIWVSPLHRRMHIAKKLISAVCMNTIMGEEIPLNMVAFSAPTEDGKIFAQRVTGNENFFVYQ